MVKRAEVGRRGTVAERESGSSLLELRKQEEKKADMAEK